MRSRAKRGVMSPVKHRLPQGHYEDNPFQFSPDQRKGHGVKEFYGALESINEQMACQ